MISGMMGEDNNSWGDYEGFKGSNRISLVTNDGTMKHKNGAQNTIRTGFGTGANHTEGRFFNYGYDHRMRKIKMPDGEDAHGWIYKAESYFEVIEVDPREQLRAAVLCMEAGRLRGVSEEVMEGTFIKGLNPDLRSSVRVMQPVNLGQAMKLAMMIDGNKAQSSSQVVVPSGGQTTIKGEHFRKMTKSELEERRAKGLCFWCEEKYKPGNRCAPHTLHVMIVDDSDVAENEPYLQVKPWDHALKAD
nr:ankyrin repeat-containing protein [Tanacetum cinerariifolium]